MPHTRGKVLFHIAGAMVVALWMALMGIWIHRNVTDGPQASEIDRGKPGVSQLRRDWMGIYLKDKKVGYAMNQISPFENAYLIQEEIVLNLNLLGQSSVMRSMTRAVVDEDFFLKNFLFSITSGVVSFRVSGRVDGDVLHVRTGAGRNQEQFTLQLEGPVAIGAGLSHYFEGRDLVPGASFSFPLFDPSTMSQKQVKIRVVEKEPVVIRRITYPAYRLEMRMFGRDLVFWVDEQGTLLKEEGFMGLSLIKSSGAEATKGLGEGDGADFYELAAISVARKLSRPERIRRLKVRLKGVPLSTLDREVVHQGRQQLNQDVLDIVQEKSPIKATYQIPYKDAAQMQPYLQPELTIQSGHPAVLKKAREISRDDKDPVQVARKLMQWVYSTVEKRPVVSVPSALEVLKHRVGDCNEHAVLLTALLRAVGIPARVCAGVVYTTGRFYYHAWAEAYFGTWVSMDPTLNQMPADATHIKLAEDTMEKQADLMTLMGNLELEVIDYAYDSPH